MPRTVHSPSNPWRAPKSSLDPSLEGVDRVMSLIGEKYSAHILYSMFLSGPQRFVTLQNLVPGGICPRTLSMRLKSLQENGLIRREEISTKPSRVDYILTPEGESLAYAFQPLSDWGEGRRRSPAKPVSGA